MTLFATSLRTACRNYADLGLAHLAASHAARNLTAYPPEIHRTVAAQNEPNTVARCCIAQNIAFSSRSLSAEQKGNSASDVGVYWAVMSGVLWKQARCAMKMQLTVECHDDDEKLNDRDAGRLLRRAALQNGGDGSWRSAGEPGAQGLGGQRPDGERSATAAATPWRERGESVERAGASRQRGESGWITGKEHLVRSL